MVFTVVVDHCFVAWEEITERFETHDVWLLLFLAGRAVICDSVNCESELAQYRGLSTVGESSRPLSVNGFHYTGTSTKYS
jgi:hypothetical protein